MLRPISLIVSFTLAGLPSIFGGTLTPIQDNQVQSGANATKIMGTNGSDPTMQLAARDGDFNRKVYLDFDITSALSAGQEFSDATLSLTTSGLVGSAGSFPSVTFNVYGLTGATTWSESTITWNTAPYNNTPSALALDTARSILLGTFTVTTSNVTNQTYTFNGGSGALATYLNWAAGRLGDYYGTTVTSRPAASIVLTAATGPNSSQPGVAIYSSESTTPAYVPALTFTTAASPEAASAATLAAGGCL